MPRQIRLTALPLLLMASAQAADALRPDGEARPLPPDAALVIPSQPSETERFAAQLLQDALAAITGRKPEVVGQDYLSPDRPFVSLGRTRLLDAADLPPRALGEVGYAIEEKDGNWYIR
ncbi:MAG: hypothetical protein FWF86_09405, partial [Clostridia bacterium]|nr:hypothetical protein [Clostridia bacterium]